VLLKIYPNHSSEKWYGQINKINIKFKKNLFYNRIIEKMNRFTLVVKTKTSKIGTEEVNTEYSSRKKFLFPTYAIFLQTANAQKRMSFSSCHLHLYKKNFTIPTEAVLRGFIH
jgi:hypothetical protein